MKEWKLSRNIIGIPKSRRMKWSGHVAHIRKKINCGYDVGKIAGMKETM
jgi:hypothetical protein